MKYAILAAGEGSRLLSEGITTPKPLITIKGESMIDRLIRIFCNNEATDIYIIYNEQMEMLHSYLQMRRADIEQHWSCRLHLVQKTTPSSMHSLYELSLKMDKAPFVLTTVDTIFDEDEFSSYIKTFSSIENCDALMGVTTYIDDESPLYVSVDNAMCITGFHDTNTENYTYVSAGIYGLYPRTFDTLSKAISRGEQRMRNFQRGLVADGLNVRAYKFSKVFDIDHKKDMLLAEKFLG